ncbi:MAG: preprotein translocase subunit SecG [Candidatus Omnitrophota bacterium]|nr:preprotein translocase subunit SecG [Candidatus Omnitrophota bacterium]
MSLFLTIIHVIVCFILIAVILLQAGRGQGLSGASFGSGNVQSLFGTGGADFMTKATLVAAVCFIVTCLGLDIIEVQKSRSLLQADRPGAPINIDQIKEALEKVRSEAGSEAAEAVAEAEASLEETAAAVEETDALQEALSRAKQAVSEAAESIPPVQEPES